MTFSVGEEVLVVSSWRGTTRHARVTSVGRKYVYVDGDKGRPYDKVTGELHGGGEHLCTQAQLDAEREDRRVSTAMRDFGVDPWRMTFEKRARVYAALRPLIEAEQEAKR